MSKRRLAKGQYPDRDIKPRRDKRRWDSKPPKRRCDDCGSSVDVYVNKDGSRTCDACEYGRAA